MSDKTLKTAWITLAIIILILCFITIVWTDVVTEYLSPNHLILISGMLCLLFFIFKLMWEKNNPPSKFKIQLGWAFAGISFCYLIYVLFKIL